MIMIQIRDESNVQIGSTEIDAAALSEAQWF